MMYNVAQLHCCQAAVHDSLSVRVVLCTAHTVPLYNLLCLHPSYSRYHTAYTDVG